MTITLTPPQQEWIDAHVARGDYPSVEDAARSLIDMAIADLQPFDADLSWAKEHVAEALDEIARGEVLTLEEHRRRNTDRLGIPSAE